MNTDFERIRQIFLAIVEQPSAQWEKLLDETCGADTELRQQVALLLQAHAAGEGILDRDEAGIATTRMYEPASERAGTVIGPYKLLQQIGEGGMGIVFMAEQTKPVERKVALKVIKAGMDSRQVIARFEAERQALALMDHPNIARVLDAGTIGDDRGAGGAPASQGRPYFVMELVKGISITKYCDEHHLTPKERLELFMPVCQAMQHAHQKGIIHRDLKPSNVLVAEYDDKPVAKVIDFGVAKATGSKLTDRTMFTEFGQVIGTLEYMSPEAAKLNALDIDTRSDIYALGVLLYELLTGTTPFEKKRLRQVALDVMLQMIREEEPPRPSTRLSTTEELPSIAANRGLEPKKLNALLRGELDWIVMKALEKDRNRRYGTADGLAQDIERYLHDKPVAAGPPGAAYRLRKFVRRNRGPVLAASVVLLALLSGIAGTTLGLVEARRQRDAEEVARDAEAMQRRQAVAQQGRAEAAEALAKERLIEANRQKQRTEEEAAIARAVNEFLRNDLLGQADISNQASLGGASERNPNITIRQLLDRSAKTIGGKFVMQPLTEAAIRLTIGAAYRALGQYDEAERHLERSLALRRQRLGATHLDTLDSMHHLGFLYKARGRYDEAEALYKEVLEGRRLKLGADHARTLEIMNNLAALYLARDRYDEAEALFKQVLEKQEDKLGRGHTRTLTAMSNLATAYLVGGQPAKAVPLLEQALAKNLVELGADHPGTMSDLHNLAAAYYEAGQFDKAMQLLEQGLEKKRVKLGANHPDTLSSMQNLAGSYWATGRQDKALRLFEETLEKQRAMLGAEHPDTLRAMSNLGLAYRDYGQPGKATPLLETALEKQRAKLGDDHRDTLMTMCRLALVYVDAGQMGKGVPLLEIALEKQRARLPADHPNTLMTMSNLGSAYDVSGQLGRAMPLLEAALEKQRAKLGADHRDTLHTMNNLAGVYQETGQSDRAEQLRRELLRLRQKKDGPESPATAGAMAALSDSLLRQKKNVEAEAVLRACLAIRAKRMPEQWLTFNTRSMLGAALLGQRKYNEAEPLLLDGYQGMKHGQAQVEFQVSAKQGQARLAQALERLVELYEATGQKEKADQWRQKLKSGSH